MTNQGDWRNVDHRCPKCGFYNDTPNHELGCQGPVTDRLQEIRDRLAEYMFTRGHPTAGVATGEFVAVAMDDLAFVLAEVDRLRADLETPKS